MTRILAFMAAFLAASLFVVGHAAQAKGAASSAGYDPAQVDGVCANVVGNLWERTDVYFDAGDYPRSIALDKIIAAADPSFVDAYGTGAWLLDSLGKKDQAEAFYKEAVANNPQTSFAYYNLGWFYYNSLHDYNKALAVFQADVKTPDADVNDWKMLAHSYEKLGRFKKALAVWVETKKLFPNGPAVDFNLAQAKQRVASEGGSGSSQ